VHKVLLILLLVVMAIYSPPACGQILSMGAEFADLTGNYSDRGIDINEDGKFDYLVIDAGVHIMYPGEYSLSGYLYDKDNREIVWSADHRNFTDGNHIMQLAFDGKSIEKRKLNGPYRLGNVTFTWGSASKGQIPCAMIDNVYKTGPYNATDFVDPVNTDKILSGSGNGELLLTISIKKSVPVFSERYMYDIVGLKMPPLSTPIKITSSWDHGYNLNTPGIFIPGKPNNFTVMASKVKNINIGVMKLQGDLERTWVSSQFLADGFATARADTDLISPSGSYHVKIFGDAAQNETKVDLMMSVTKKLVVSGPFNLVINTTGFPSGSYRISAKALNGSFSFDEMELNDQETTASTGGIKRSGSSHPIGWGGIEPLT
jgi:hypothetical protein